MIGSNGKVFSYLIPMVPLIISRNLRPLLLLSLPLLPWLKCTPTS